MTDLLPAIFTTVRMLFQTATLLGPGLVLSSQVTAQEKGIEFFERRIRPVLVEKCFGCHSKGADGVKAGLNLDSRRALLSGGDSGAAIIPGQPDASLLIESIRYQPDSLMMPPDGRLSDSVVADFEKWVADGAVWPKEDQDAHPDDRSRALVVTDRDREFWSFVPVQNPEIPEPLELFR